MHLVNGIWKKYKMYCSEHGTGGGGGGGRGGLAMQIS